VHSLDGINPDLAVNLKDVPTAGTFNFELINYRLGKMVNADTQRLEGIILQFWLAPIPWFKFHIPFRMPYLSQFMDDLIEEYERVIKSQETPAA
jgi:hypothetical protein